MDAVGQTASCARIGVLVDTNEEWVLAGCRTWVTIREWRMADITEFLSAARAGDPAAERDLQALVYQRLHELAHGQLQGDRRLAQTTSLVHEVYLRLALPSQLAVADRGHFFAVAGTAMRQGGVGRARAAHAPTDTALRTANAGASSIPSPADQRLDTLGAAP